MLEKTKFSKKLPKITGWTTVVHRICYDIGTVGIINAPSIDNPAWLPQLMRCQQTVSAGSMLHLYWSSDYGSRFVQLRQLIKKRVPVVNRHSISIIEQQKLVGGNIQFLHNVKQGIATDSDPFLPPDPDMLPP